MYGLNRFCVLLGKVSIPKIVPTLIVVAAAVLVGLPPTSSASVQSRIDRVQGNISSANARKQVLTSDISGFNQQITSLDGRLAGLRARESRIQTQLDSKRNELERVRVSLAQERARHARLKKRLARSQDALAKRLRRIFEENDPELVTVVLESDGFADLLHRLEFINRISDADADLVKLVKRLKAESKRKAERLVELEAQVTATVNAIREKRNQLAETRSGLEKRAAELSAARARRRSALATIRRRQSNLEGSLASLRKEQASISRKLQGVQPPTGPGSPSPGPIRRGSGQFIWPVNGPINGVFGEPRPGHMHAGIDIGVSSGTPVRAAGSGQVVSAGGQGGYGLAVVINHGGGLATLYAHLSSIGVSSGAHVSQGEVIGNSGCTGTCYGPHVHFEVHVNGSAVDPMGYL